MFIMVSRAVSFAILFFSMTISAVAQNFGTGVSLGQVGGAATRQALSISGLIRTHDGRPAKDARIEIHSRQNGQVVAYAYANASGSFEINLPHGFYEVVGQLGLEETRETVILEATDMVVSLRLPGSAPPEAGGRYSVSVAQMRVPDKARKAYKKAQEAMEKDKIAEASQHVAKALEIHPKYAEALTLQGILKLENNSPEEALADLQRALEYDGNYPTAYLALGATYNALERYDEALRVLDRGVGLSPRAWQGYFEMGKAFLGKRNYEASIRQLIKAQDLDPKYPLIHLVKAHALLGMKNYPDAMTELELYLQQNPQGRDSANARETLERVRGFSARPSK
jgi:tetratricopeptide (TPR) repeat protein